MSMKKTLISVLFVISAIPVIGRQELSAVPCQEVPHLIQQFAADRRAINRFYVVAMSPERRARLVALYNDYLKSLAQLDFDALNQECKVDYILFQRNLNEYLRFAQKEEDEFTKVSTWFPFADSVYAMEKTRRRGASVDAKRVALYWNNLTKEVKQLSSQLVESDARFTTGEILTAKQAIAGFRTALTNVYEFYNGYDPSFTWWAERPFKQLDSMFNRFSVQFESKLPPPDSNGIVSREPVGRDELVKLFTYEMIPYTPEEIYEIAEKEMAWCDQELIKASRELGFGDDWKKANEYVKDQYVDPGKQPEAILRLYNESIDFLKAHDLITIPPLAEETWGMIMMTPDRQRYTAFFTGGWEISISYPTNTMDIDQRLMSMRGNNPHFSRATVHHELIPGHNLQYFMRDRYRTYRAEFSTPFWMEGWALYWELLLWDLKFPQTPEDKIGMLFWRRHRCARIIFSLNFHLGKWTPQQCIDYLVDHVGHERANAESEIRGPLSAGTRGAPLYQIAYLLGGIQMMHMKNELVDSGQLNYRDFHDRIIKLNAMPMEMIRAILTDQPLAKEFRTNWRFYDE
ncbi:Uncharacterized conserved protein, DUF885 familyt [Parapedobacter luteus]|uniref:Uncharacterized conserved protein, DUF885 familyt n=1 Tax=Parapedobacter luteus TaxID=623280 RepID=A0A1T4ZVG5_9SPHI|nr:DUF885 family protein [Parapedobacter luteus]SKB26761.1 Uncharacterized conserved protein, DUF885 familyt [Parapedobacter luteus]